MDGRGFGPLVSLACHDLRTPLATVNGFAKTLTRTGTLGEREAHFVDLIEAAADQMTSLLDMLGLAARIESGRYDPVLAEADTLELATSTDERIATEGAGESIETDVAAISRSLESLARCAALHGGLHRVTWQVAGHRLTLSPLAEDARHVVTGESPRDLGALVARLAIEHFGGSLAVDGDTLVVKLLKT
jgi:signal transduction histidine kinase